MRTPLRSLATLLLTMGLATCTDAPSVGPRPANAPGKGRFALAPVFSRAAAAVFAQRTLFADVNFDHVRVVLVRPPSEVVKDTTIAFTPSSPPLTLELTVTVRNVGESFLATVEYINSAAPVFRGTATVQAHAPDEPTPAQEIVVQYVGVGANATRLAVTPKTLSLEAPKTVTFSAAAFDAAGNPVANVPLNWSSSDPSVATINATSGVLATTGKRGTTTVTARTPTSVTDNASVSVTLPATGITLISGGGQTGKAGAILAQPGVVRVVASDGVGVAGVSVTFAAPTGGSVGTPSATTDANGQASTTLTLGGAVGPQSFAAAAAAFSVSIPATATAADPSSIVAFSGSGQSDTVRRVLKAPFVARVTDRFGNVIPGLTVTWARTAGTGTLASTTSVTNGEGLASVGYTLGATVGPETVTATASGIAGAATFTATALTSGPAAIAAVSGSGQVGRAAQPLGAPFVVRVTDDAGGPVSGVSVTWTAVNGSFGASTTTTDAQGQSSNTMTLGGALGPASATATSGGKSVSFTATVQPGVVAQMGFRVGPSSATVGAVLTPAIQLELRDAGGNLTAAANAVTIGLGANPGGATLGGTLTRTSVAGVATFDNLTFDKAGTGYTLVASSAGVSSVTSGPFNITSVTAPAGSIALVDGTTLAPLPVSPPPSVVMTAGQAPTNPPAIKVFAASGAGLPGVTIAYAVTRGGTPVFGGTATSDAQGIITFAALLISPANLTVAGNYVFTATLAGVTGSPINLPVTVVPSAANKLAITIQPSTIATSGAPLAQQPVIQVQDQFGNPVGPPVGTTALQVTATPSAGTATGNSVAANATSGTATFTALALTGSGSVTVTFSATGLQSVVSNAITVNPSGLGRTWTGAVSSDWNVAGNWSGGVPTVTNNVIIPAGTPYAPILTSVVVVNDITVAAGATILTGTFGLAANGNVDAGTTGISGSGPLTMTGTGTTLRGKVENVGITGTVSVTPSATITGSLIVAGGGSLAVTGASLSAADVGVFGHLTIGTGATVSATSVSVVTATGLYTQTGGAVAVSTSVVFGGASTVGQITGGSMTVGGGFAQTNGVSPLSFVASGTHQVILTGSAAQTVSFASPGAGASHFQDLAINGPGTVVVASAVVATGQLISSTGPSTVQAGANTITVAGLNVDGLVLDNTRLTSSGGTITRFDNVTFQNYAATATPLTISHPGAATPFVFNTVQFLVTPSTGAYLNVTDSNPSDGQVLTISLIGSTPADGSSQTATSGGALVQWGGAGAANSWSNAAGGSWSNPANWSLGRVPITSDSVVIALGGTYTVTLDTTFTGTSITVGGASGVQTLSISSRTLTLSNALRIRANGVFSPNSSVVAGSGTVINQGIINLTASTLASATANQALLRAAGSSAINGALTTVAASIIRVEGNGTAGSSSLAVTSSFTNSGAIELTSAVSTYTASLSLTAGTLTNAPGGTISSLAGSGGARALIAELNNQGTMTVNQPTTMGRAGAAHVNSGTIDLTNGDLTLSLSGTTPSFTNSGTVTIGTGRVWAINGGTLNQSAGTIGGPGTLSVASATANFTTNFTNATTALVVTNSTLNGPGTITNAAGRTLMLQTSVVSAPLINQGTMIATGTTAINGPLSVATGSILRIEGNGTVGSSALTIANGFTNSGAIELTSIVSTYSATLTVTTGTLTNAAGGTISSLAGTGGARTLAAQLNNQGTVTVNQPLTIGRASSAHANSGTIDVTNADLTLNQTGTTPSFTNSGTVTIGAGHVWTINNGTLNQSAGTIGGPGMLSLSTATANFTTNFTNATTLLAVTNSLLNGPGTITNATGRTLTLQSSTIGATSGLINQGTVIATGGTVINGTLTTATGSILRIEGNGSVGSSTLTVANGFTNNGGIELTSIVSTYGATLTVTNGTLTNAAGGTISALVGAGGARTLNAELNNQGFLTATNTLTMSRASSAHVNNGTINVTGGDLTVTQSGTSPSFTNTGTVTLSATSVWTINGGTLNQGAGTVGGPGTLSLLSVTANFTTSFTNATTGLLVSNSTLNGPGTITNAAGRSLSLVSSTIGSTSTLINQGIVIATGTSAINGALTTTSGSFLRIEGNGSVGASTLTVTNGFSNIGTVDLTSIVSAYNASLNVPSGVLTNAVGGTINSLAGTGGARTINAELQNQGTVTVDQALTISRAGAQHNNSGTILVNQSNFAITQTGTTPSFTNAGTITIAAGRTATISGGTFTQGGTLNGGGGLAVSGATAAFNTGFTLGSLTLLNTLASFQTSLSTAAVALNFTNSTINGPGTITNAPGQTLNLQGSIIGATSGVTNQGTLVATATSDINGPLTMVSGSILRMEGNSSVGGSSLTVANGFTNHGDIQLTSIASAYNATLAVTNGTLANSFDGTINALAGTGGARTLNAELSNNGTVTVSRPLTMSRANSVHVNAGQISVTGADLIVIQSGTGSFNNSGAITVSPGRTLTIDGRTFSHNNVLIGGGGLTLANVTAVFGDVFTLGNLTLTSTTATFGSSVSTAGLDLFLINSTVNGGSITNVAGQTMNLQTSHIAATTALTNAGTLISTGLSSINGLLTTATGSVVRVEGNSGVGNATLTVSNASGYTNNGTIELTSAGSALSSTLAVTGGTLVNAIGGTINSLAGTGGTRAINGPLLNNLGTISVAPGASQIVTIGGSLTTLGTINLELGGLTAGTQYDRIAVTGALTVGGTINVGLINGFTPASGSQFDVLTFGTFTDNSATYVLPGGLAAWTPSIVGNLVRLTKN